MTKDRGYGEKVGQAAKQRNGGETSVIVYILLYEYVYTKSIKCWYDADVFIYTGHPVHVGLPIGQAYRGSCSG